MPEGDSLRQMEADARIHAAHRPGDIDAVDADLVEACGGEFGAHEDALA
jgi:hypothetical protein